MDVVRGPSYEGRDINEDIRKWGPEKNIRIYIYIYQEILNNDQIKRNETSGDVGRRRKQKCIKTFRPETWMERRIARPWRRSTTSKRLLRKYDGVVWIGLIWLGTDRSSVELFNTEQ